jgi:hypothetical protein
VSNFVGRKSIVTVAAAAALAASLAAFAPSSMPEAKPGVVRNSALLPPAGKSDRLPESLKGAACSSHGWPYYEQNCKFDIRRSNHDAQMVRVIVVRNYENGGAL